MGRSQRATLYSDHASATFKLDGADGAEIEVSQQSDQLRHAGVTGCVVWNGAIVLAKTLAFWEEDLKLFCLAGRKVLELGAGTGFFSLAAAMHGARVVATEQGERLKLLRRNVARHGVSHESGWMVGKRGGSVE